MRCVLYHSVYNAGLASDIIIDSHTHDVILAHTFFDKCCQQIVFRSMLRRSVVNWFNCVNFCLYNQALIKGINSLYILSSVQSEI